MTDDPWNDPGAQEWMHHVKTHVLPMVERSNVCISLCPPKDKVDIKFAVELGMMIMLDKPLLVVAESDEDVPAKLRAVADNIVIADITTPRGRARFMEVMNAYQDAL